MGQKANKCHNLFDSLNKAQSEFELYVPGPNGSLLPVVLRIDAICAFFKSQRLGIGDRITIISDKDANYFAIYLASLKYGLIFNPLNPAYSERELDYFLTDFCPDLLLTKASLTSNLNQKVRKSVKITEINEDIYDYGLLRNCVAPVKPGDLAAVLYSSGTTGLPKAIGISHENLRANASSLSSEWALKKSDKLLHALPMYHIHGLFISLNSALMAGTKIIALASFTVKDVLAHIDQATIFMGVPTYYSRILNSPLIKNVSFSSIRLFISGSAPLPEMTLRRFEALTEEKIIERYGMTETGVITSNPVIGERKLNSVGKAIRGMSLKIEGSDKLGKKNKIGEVCVRGRSVSRLVLDKDGWFRTGDLGYFDNEGYLYLVGRSKDMIITGGMNVYPKEIERQLEYILPTRDVAVFGVPHKDFGEAVVAAITGSFLKNDEIQEKLSSLSTKLANYKLPKAIICVDVLPTNAMGKVQKNILRDEFLNYFEV